VFDEAKGETARHSVDDPRVTAAAEAYLQRAANGVEGDGPSVPERTASDTAHVGWTNRGSATNNAIIIETNHWDTHFLASWVATILLKERVSYNVAHINAAAGAGPTFCYTFGRMAPGDGRGEAPNSVERVALVVPLDELVVVPPCCRRSVRSYLFQATSLSLRQRRGGEDMVKE